VIDSATETNESRRLRFFKGSVRDQALRLSRQLIGSAVFLAACMWAIIAGSLWSEYDRAWAQARTQEYNLVAALAGELRQTFDSTQRAFTVIQRDVVSASKTMPLADALRQAGSAEHLVLGQDRDLVLADADGQILFSTDPGETVGDSIANAPHFLQQKAQPDTTLRIDSARHGSRALIAASQGIRDAQGHFLGEAIQLLPISSLLTLHREFNLGAQGLVTITNAKGLVLACFDRNNENGTLDVGQNMRGGAFPEDLPPDKTALFMRSGEVDRMIAIRRVNRYDLDVLVGLAVNEALRAARVHIWLICFLGLAATGLIGGLTTLLVREVWHRTRKEIELAADRERLQHAQAQIEIERSRLAETNRELVASKERAEIANRTKSQFLAHMSHELRTPLHAIIGFSELIRDQAPAGPRDPPLGEYSNDILTSGRHLLDLINTILDITKIESGTAVLTESMFPLSDLVRNALVTIRAQADLRHISIDVRLPDSPIRLFADRTRMLQVLINLLSNAVKFTHEDGQIVVSATINPGGDLVLSVIDSGIGMTETEVQIALEPFGQVDSALSRSYQGTGLGLPLAVRLMELHGGRLEVTSIKGKGTAVRATIPAKRVALRSGLAA
jgi:two-component system cell cycle sensor histidine kinase PleC